MTAQEHTHKPQSRAMLALRRKLETAELDHLRALCLDLHTQLEQITKERDDAIDNANFWGDHAHQLQCELWEHTDLTVGITQDGQIGIVSTQAEVAA